MDYLLFNQIANSDSPLDLLVNILLFNARAAILLLSCFIVMRMLKASAAIKHFLVFVAIASLLVLPLTSQLIPAFDIVVEVTEPIAANIISSSGLTLITNNQTDTAPLTLSPLLIIGTYILGSASILLIIFLNNLKIFLLIKNCQSVKQKYWLNALKKHKRALGIKRKIHLRYSGKIGSPSTWGALQPSILLPRNALQWPDHLIKSTLLHELGHIKRNDWLTQQIARSICSLYWINPFCWKALNKLYANAETASDDIAINSGVTNTHYANNLVNVAEHVIQSQKINIAVISMAALNHQSQLIKRVMAILDSNRHHNPISKSHIGLTLIIFSCLLIPLASLRANYTEVIISDISEDESINIPLNIIENNLLKTSIQTVSIPPYIPADALSEIPFAASAPDLGIKLNKVPKKVIVEKVKMKLSHKITELGRSLVAESNLLNKNKQQNSNQNLETDTLSTKKANDQPAENDTIKHNSSKPSIKKEFIKDKQVAENTVINHSRKKMIIPKYPNTALSRKIEGKVTVSYSIDEHGNVFGAKIISTESSRLLERSALKAIKKSTFSPRMINGQAVATTGLTEKYVFILKS